MRLIILHDVEADNSPIFINPEWIVFIKEKGETETAIEMRDGWSIVVSESVAHVHLYATGTPITPATIPGAKARAKAKRG